MSTTTMSASNLIRESINDLAVAVVELQYRRQPDIWEPYGDAGRAQGIRDAGYHLDYLAEAIDANDPTLFYDYAEWVQVLFNNLGFPGTVLSTTLECTHEAIFHHLSSADTSEALTILTGSLHHLKQTPVTTASYLNGDQPINRLAQKYLSALLVGDRQQASRMILDAVEKGTSVKEIYLNVFQAGQYELGRLWHTGQITVAQEHYCTAATQLTMSQLYPYILNSSRQGPQMVITCVGGELHEIGARMVADFFEMEGWNTYFTGANMPVDAVLAGIVERKANILAISATMTFHIKLVRELISLVRKMDYPVRILVGGRPFNSAPDLWRNVGADGTATNAQEAIDVAERLVQ
jgi:methanogenic corrinoid protein MtbC1